MNTLVFDLQRGSWLSFDTRLLNEPTKELKFNSRKGYYPYSYNFVRRHRGDLAQCYLCGNFIPMKEMTRDHTYPRSKGGEITSTACYRCNTKKRDMSPVEWAIKSLDYDFVYLPH